MALRLPAGFFDHAMSMHPTSCPRCGRTQVYTRIVDLTRDAFIRHGCLSCDFWYEPSIVVEGAADRINGAPRGLRELAG